MNTCMTCNIRHRKRCSLVRRETEDHHTCAYHSALGAPVFARINPDVLDLASKFFTRDGVDTEGCKDDPEFVALCAKIAGQRVRLTFTAGDAFEAGDDNYWLPETCFDLEMNDEPDPC